MNPITFLIMKRVSNGYVVRAHDVERNLVSEQVHAELDAALDAVSELPWLGEEVAS